MRDYTASYGLDYLDKNGYMKQEVLLVKAAQKWIEARACTNRLREYEPDYVFHPFWDWESKRLVEFNKAIGIPEKEEN